MLAATTQPHDVFPDAALAYPDPDPIYPSNVPSIYGAVYSHIPVYEMICRKVAVMKRRADSFVNATQVAGIEKGKRTKMLEKEITLGVYEKVQGGYGKYQGTWIPFARGVELAQNHNVYTYLAPLFDFQPNSVESEEQDLEILKKTLKKPPPSLLPLKRSYSQQNQFYSPDKNREYDGNVERYGASLNGMIPNQIQGIANMVQLPIPHERQRALLMSLFTREDEKNDVLTNPVYLGIDYNMSLDQYGNTALHWASTLGKINVVRGLVKNGADVRVLNLNNETALIRSVLATNNFDYQVFPDLLTLLRSNMQQIDHTNKSILHHICQSSLQKTLKLSSKYYLECALEKFITERADMQSLVNIQDDHGDTAMNIAARIGSDVQLEMLVACGGLEGLVNKAGLCVFDYGFGERSDEVSDAAMEEIEVVDVSAMPTEDALRKVMESNSPVKGRSVAEAIQCMVNELNQTYKNEITTKKSQLSHIQSDLLRVTKELSSLRKSNTQLKKENTRLPELITRIKHLEKLLYDEWQRIHSELALISTYKASPPTQALTHSSSNASTLSTTSQPTQDPKELTVLKHEIYEKNKALVALRKRIMEVGGKRQGHEWQCRKIISIFCGVDVGEVDGLVDALTVACESDGKDGFHSEKVAMFMQKVKDQENAMKVVNVN